MVTLEAVLADDLRDHGAQITRLVIERVDEELPALLAGEEPRRLARDGTGALLREFGTVLRLGLREGFRAPPEALAYGRHLAHTGAPLAAVLRS